VKDLQQRKQNFESLGSRYKQYVQQSFDEKTRKIEQTIDINQEFLCKIVERHAKTSVLIIKCLLLEYENYSIRKRVKL